MTRTIDAELLIEPPFDLCLACVHWRSDLDNEIRALDPRGRLLAHTFVREQHVGFHHIEVRKDHIEGRSKDAADRMLLQIYPDERTKIHHDRLVLTNRCGRHVVLPVDQLVPLPVLGKLQEVVVGELHAGIARPHRIAPSHALILAA
jgi:hypothetical protein